MRTSTPPLLGKPAALIVPLLLFLGCGIGRPQFQTVPVAGSAVGAGQFAGRWYDQGGELFADVSNRSTPRLGMWLPVQFILRDARVQDGRLLFHIESEWSVSPALGTFTFAGEDTTVMDQVSSSGAGNDCFCKSVMAGPAIVLIRNPSPLWLAKRSLRDTTRLIKKSYQRAYDTVLDRLSRIL